MAGTAKERLWRYLADAHAAEQGVLAALEDLVAQARDAGVRAAAQEHRDQTRSHAEALAQRLAALGGAPSGVKGFVDRLIAKGSNYVNAFHDDQDKETQDVIKIYALENFEIAMYASLRAYAEAVGDSGTAALAQTLMTEEQAAAERFRGLIAPSAVAAVNRTGDVALGT